jgi:hypothetical protein
MGVDSRDALDQFFPIVCRWDAERSAKECSMPDVAKGLGVFLLGATLAAQGPTDDSVALQVIRAEARDRSSAANGHTSVLAELRGRTKPREVVLAGAHLDSWQVGTGATDNGANCAVLIDALRILKASKLPLARTVRIALWAGEERGLRGSTAYVTRLTAQSDETLSLYINADSGAGRYRGLQVQERMEFAPVAEDGSRHSRGTAKASSRSASPTVPIKPASIARVCRQPLCSRIRCTARARITPTWICSTTSSTTI